MVKTPAPPIRLAHPLHSTPTTSDNTSATPDEDPYIAEPNDIIGDVLRIVISMAPEFSHALARQVDAQARAAWGGDKPYIATHSADSYSSRNQAIIRDYLAGERIAYLERKYGLSRARVWQIIKGL